MRTPLKNSASIMKMLIFGSIVLAAASRGSNGTQNNSPTGWVRFLSHQSASSDEKEMEGTFTCGQAAADRDAARSLAKFGNSAIPEIEKELDAMEDRGPRLGDGSPWLELSYARIKGPIAFARLHRMEGDPKAGINRENMDSSIALSLGLTSYVSDSRLLLHNFDCFRGPEPRDALDRLILGWEKNDRQWLEASLGPHAKEALATLLGKSSWYEMRADILQGRLGTNLAIGYRFEILGRWSEPPIVLDERLEGDKPTSDSLTPEIETVFKDRSGNDCAKQSVKFIGQQPDAGQKTFLVDNADVGDLLRAMSSCMARK